VEGFSMSGRQFALFNLVLVAVWLFLAIRIGRKYQALAQESPASSVSI
jgi:hypothetical protein